jgi:hypothetical protein
MVSNFFLSQNPSASAAPMALSRMLFLRSSVSARGSHLSRSRSPGRETRRFGVPSV